MIIKAQGLQPISVTTLTQYTTAVADAQEQTIVAVAFASIIEGSFWYLFNAGDSTVYLPYFYKVVDTPPAVLDTIPVRIDISGASTDQDVSDAIVTAINGAGITDDFTAANGGGTLPTVTIVNDDNGGSRTMYDGNLPTGLAIARTVQGITGAADLLNLYRVIGNMRVVGEYQEGNTVRSYQFRTQPVDLIIHGNKIDWISEDHNLY